MDKTEAEKRLENALTHIRAAADELTEVLIRGCEGSELVSAMRKRFLHSVLVKLLSIVVDYGFH